MNQAACLGDQWRPCKNCAGHGCPACDGQGIRLLHEHAAAPDSAGASPSFSLGVQT